MPDKEATPRNLLFLCTGNYYRSRFAEMLFNARAREMRLPWQAHSRGVALDRGIRNVGPISFHVLKGLESRGVLLTERIRFPLQVNEQDLIAVDLIIALEETEHRALLAERFPHWPDKVEYWHIPDSDRTAVAEALAEIEREVTRLLVRLAQK